jgi:ech hydrogenase subunit F
MLSSVLANLLSKPATRSFPKTRRHVPDDVRGTVEFDTKECVYCGACSLKCPAEAIDVNRSDRTMSFDLFKCIGCNCCVEACKHGCIQMQAAYHAPVYEKPTMLLQGVPIGAGEGD